MASHIHWEKNIGRRFQLRELHVFFTVAKRGSMAKAATELGITQPSVSAVIGSLETSLGVRLFDRGPSGVEPTPFGRALLSRVQAAFDELRQGVKDIEFLSEPTAGEVRSVAPNRSPQVFCPRSSICCRKNIRASPLSSRASIRRPSIFLNWASASSILCWRAWQRQTQRTCRPTMRQKSCSTIGSVSLRERAVRGLVAARSTLRSSPMSPGSSRRSIRLGPHGWPKAFAQGVRSFLSAA